MKKLIRTRLITIITIFVVISFFIWWGTKPNTMEGKSHRQPIYSVKVIYPQVKDMPVTLQEVGSVEAETSVNVISQVAGTLRKIDITQGQMVTAGQLLFEIDPAFYQADVLQAQANLQRDQAQLAFLQATANRYAGLAKLEYITRQQYDQALAAVKEQEAVVAGDQAILQQKQLQLSYTQIRAPIAGKSGAITVHVGDLIPANSATPLLVINRLEKVLVSFNIPQDRLSDLLAYQRAGTLKLQVLNEAGGRLLAEGELAFVGNVVSPQTGTVQVKGEVANQDLQLWPGQLVTVKLILTTEPNAQVIPALSVQLGQKGNYVYVVKNNKAVIQPITVSRQVDSESVISSGLQISDAIIAEIPPGLKEGSQVKIESPTGSTSPAASSSRKKHP